jgi:hypothetical protein
MPEDEDDAAAGHYDVRRCLFGAVAAVRLSSSSSS